ncbi:MAG: glycosyltransferase family 2 protein [Candidatus Acidiferrales bacterium]
MTKPIISALIDTYNHERYIEQAIVSVLEQGLSPSELEIVVVDDGSTDNTASLVAKFAPRIGYIRKKNGGQVSAFNAAIPETHAPIVAFLDADDWWAKGKLRPVLEAFEQNPGIAAVGHGYFEVRGDAFRTESVVPERTYCLSLANAETARIARSGCTFLSTSKLAVRRRLLDQIGPVSERFAFFDIVLMSLALALGGAIVLDQALGFYRLHQGNLYESRSTNPADLRRKYEIVRANTEFLPSCLSGAGVPSDAVSAFVQPDLLECERLRMILDGGWPWETFALELKRFRASYERNSTSYALFKWLVLASTLFMPPSVFYRMRNWYAEHNLQRFRRKLGEAVPVGIRTRSNPG